MQEDTLSDHVMQPGNAHTPARISSSSSVFIGPEGLRPGWGLLLFAALFALILSIAMMISHRVFPTLAAPHGTGPHAITESVGLRTEIIPLFVVLIVTAIMAKIERRPFGAYGLGGQRRIPQFATGLAWGIVFLTVLVITLKSAGLLVFEGRLLSGSSIVVHGAIWFGLFLLVGLFEETLLRGYLQFTLARGLTGLYSAWNEARSEAFGFWTAAFLLSLVFGLGHGSNPGESPIGLLSAGLAGLVFCFGLWRTGSLWWAIGFHATWDWAQSFLYGVADSGAMSDFHLMATHPAGKAILSGGATGPEGSIFILPLMALIAIVIMVTLPKRGNTTVLPDGPTARGAITS